LLLLRWCCWSPCCQSKRADRPPDDTMHHLVRCRHKEALASILGSCSRLISLNLSWNDLRTDPKAGWSRERKRQDMRARATLARKKGRTRGVVHGGPCGPPFASAALVHPGRLITLELSFNGLADTFGVRLLWLRDLFGGLVWIWVVTASACEEKRGEDTYARCAGGFSLGRLV